MRTRNLCLLLGVLSLVGVASCRSTEFMWPTVADVNMLTAADHDFVADGHAEIVAVITAQHELQTPELAPELQIVIEQYQLAVVELRALADEIKAEGLDTTELAALAVAAFPGLGGLVWLNRQKAQPSRSSDKVAKLESDAIESNKKVHALELALATAAGAGSAVPSGRK